MLKWLKSKFSEKPLDLVLNETRSLVLHRARFTIRKINPLDHLNGSKVLLQCYDLHKTGAEQDQIIANNKIKDHYADIFMAAVVYPELTRTQDEPHKTYVYDIFKNWDLAQDLYMAINQYTYGKKKMKSLGSLGKN